jgi:hypothetical protein
MADDYGGLLGGFVFAFRRSDSWVLRSYVVASTLVGGFAVVFLLLALFFWLGNPAPFGQRALLGVVGIFVLVPLFAPVLVVARRHRRGTGSRRGDAALGVAGYGFVLAVYLALFISDPNPHNVTGPLAAIDALPRRYWVAPVLLSVASIWLAVRLTSSVNAGTSAPEEAGDESDG